MLILYNTRLVSLTTGPATLSAISLVPLALSNVGQIPFSSSALVRSGLSRHNVHPSGKTLQLGQSIPRGIGVWLFHLPSIYSDNFFEALSSLLTQLHTDPSEQFSIIIQPELSNGTRKTLGKSFITTIKPNMDKMNSLFTPLIENFMAQSASGEGITTDSTLVSIRNVSDFPEPDATPTSSSQSNLNYMKDVAAQSKKEADKLRKRLASPSIQSQTLEAVNLI